MVEGVLIPIPPSANHLWKIFGNRQYKAPAYRAWLEEVVPFIERNLAKAEGPVQVTIQLRFGKGLRANRDIDNCIKPCLDALKPPAFDKDGKMKSPGASIIYDDSLEAVRRITVELLPAYDKKSEAECRLIVEPIEPFDLVPAKPRKAA